MPESLAVYAPLLPELIIVVGAMVLLMYGVFRPETEEPDSAPSFKQAVMEEATRHR